MRKLSKKAKRLIIDYSSAAADLTNKAIRPNFIQFGEARAALMDYIAELEKDNDEFRQLIHDWIIILTPDDGYVPDSEGVRQAMLVIDKERER